MRSLMFALLGWALLACCVVVWNAGAHALHRAHDATLMFRTSREIAQLRYRPSAEVNIARFDAWTRRLQVDLDSAGGGISKSGCAPSRRRPGSASSAPHPPPRFGSVRL